MKKSDMDLDTDGLSPDLSDEKALAQLGLSDADLEASLSGDLNKDDRAGSVPEKEEKEEEEKEVKFDMGKFDSEEPEPEPEAPVAAKSYIKKVSEKYPKLFDEFPGLKSALFKSKAFFEVFPSIDAAKEAADRLEVLKEVEADIFENGSTSVLFKRIRQAKDGDKDFARVASRILGDIRKISEEAYVAAIIPAIDELITAIYDLGIEKSDENLVNTAKVVNIYVHNTDKLPRGRKTVVGKEEKKEDEVDEREREFNLKQLKQAQQVVGTQVFDTLDSNLEKMISPTKYPNKFVRRSLITEIKREVLESLNEDDTHVSNIDALWKKAVRSGFTRETVNAIIRTNLQKIASNLPGIKNRLELEVSDKNKTDEHVVEGEKEEEIEAPNSDRNERREIDWTRTTDADYLAGRNIHYKRK